MNNEEQKAAFIAATYAEAKRAEMATLFGLFAAHEESWGRDLVQQPIEKLQPAFNEIADSIKATKAKALLAALKKYRKWYLSNHDVNAVCVGVLLLKVDLESKLRNSMAASPQHLKMILNEVFESPEKETQDCVYRVLLWMAFAGLPRDRATLVTADEVDFYNLQIHHGGKDYVIRQEGLTEFHKLCELDTLLYVHNNPYYEQRRPRLAGDQLLRGYGPKSVVIRKICDDMSRRFSKTNWALTYESMADSGFYYGKFELERCGQAVSFDELGSYAMSRNYRFGYSQWKALFPVEKE